MTARISQSILKNDKKKWQATYILTRKRQPISHFLKQYSFLLFFIARRMKRPSSSTTLIAMNRSSPHWSSTARSRKSEKKKKKKHWKQFQRVRKREGYLNTLDYRWQVSNVYTKRNVITRATGEEVIRGLKKIPFDWRVSSRESWSPVSSLELIIID